MSERYLLSRVPGVDNAWHCIDSVTGVSVTWTGSRFNDTQCACWPDGMTGGPVTMACDMRLLADWLVENHSDLL